MIKVLILITGGAIGSALRYWVSMWVQRSMLYSFPFGILSVNVIGSFLIGFCWSLAEDYNFSVNTRAFLFTGLFGGFTTFSSFALDTMSLMKTGDYKLAFINILASNILGLIAVFFGLLLGKNVLSLLK
ncbi:fluoride efflux transporter CrcB [Parabacteroides sp. TM07-1AC]|uniref:fluoride efflux transporter CrcB n=1 Tax=Parabacteroides sp. TM07-1AC TaxID=2292363 RepID=UPI000F007AE2|nr:fluoride efflux transporter CrcB [Parabacteroides sp. TM07-1AC]RHU27251.1 fluoride efflux transporter CrcB [Parabacteroides sp. TM07-1AC]